MALLQVFSHFRQYTDHPIQWSTLSKEYYQTEAETRTQLYLHPKTPDAIFHQLIQRYKLCQEFKLENSTHLHHITPKQLYIKCQKLDHLTPNQHLTNLTINTPINDIEWINHYPNLRYLNIMNSTRLPNDFPEKVSQLKHLQQLLFIGSPEISPDQYHHFSKLPLQKLKIMGGDIIDESFQHICQITTLQHLALSDTEELTDQGFQYIHQLKHLQYLYVNSDEITDHSVKYIEHTPLKYLYLGGNESVTDESLKHLPHTLQALCLSFCAITTDGLYHLRNMTQLQKLILDGCDGIDAIHPLEHLPIQRLEIWAGEGELDLQFHSHQPFPMLQYLHLAECQTITQLSELEKIPYLQSLLIQNITDVQSDDIPHLPQLKRLNLTYSIAPPSYQIPNTLQTLTYSPQILDRFDHLIMLHSIHLNYCQYTAENFPYLPNLKTITISDQVTDLGIEKILQCPIKRLVVGSLHLTTQTWTNISNHTLNSLSIEKTNITDDDLETLANSQHLTHLTLSMCNKLTTLTPLIKMVQLKRLSIRRMEQFTPEYGNEIIDQMPYTI